MRCAQEVGQIFFGRERIGRLTKEEKSWSEDRRALLKQKAIFREDLALAHEIYGHLLEEDLYEAKQQIISSARH